MKAALISEAGKNPVYGEFNESPPSNGAVRIDVSASALSQLTKGRASGSHYSSSAKFPFVAGVDGVGRTADGRRVYFVLPEFPFGGLAEQTWVDPSHCIPLPDALSDVDAAAMANPAMSSWAALQERARFVKGESVLINGATGAAGSLAVQIAKHLGAKRIVATGRNASALKELKTLGANETISLLQEPDALERDFKKQFGGEGVDVVLDYLWGPSAQALLIAAAKAGKDAVPIRFVQIGAVGGADIQLPGAVLRSSAISLMGSGLGSVPLPRLFACIEAALRAAAVARFKLGVRAVPLSQVAQEWDSDAAGARTVFTVK